MVKMTTTRGYWVDWICVFDKQPLPKELKTMQDKMERYLKAYLTALANKPAYGTTGIFGTVSDGKLEVWNSKTCKLDSLDLNIKNKGNIQSGVIIDWKKVLHPQWVQISFKPFVFNFKAYFEDNGMRYNNGRGTLTPPPPPPPPGS